MKTRIFHAIMWVAMLTLAVSLLVTTAFLYDYFGDVQTNQLRDELSLAASATERLGQDYLEPLNSDQYRLTWIASNGTVLFDTQVDALGMENHADREEVREALELGSGSSSRRSSTLTENTFYESLRLKDGTVLRISVSRKSAWILVLGMLQPILVVIVLAVVLSAVIASKMAKRVTEPFNTLDLEHPLENEVYDELSPLLSRIHRQHEQIHEQTTMLKQRQEEFERVTASMKEGLVLLDAQRRILSINPSALALFGASKLCVGENIVTIERKSALSHVIDTAFEKGHAQLREKRGDRDYQFDISRIEANGDTVGVCLLAFDVTEQVDAERLRREFSANVSHELKTPLQSILGSAELIENGLVKSEDLPRFVGRIRVEASRLVTLIEDILRLSQLDEGGELPREEIPLRALCDEVIASLDPHAAKRDITFSVAGDIGSVYGVRHLLYEAIYNLCDNAVKYNVDGGTIHVTVEDRAQTAILTVADSGIGIPAQYQERVFERFYRVDKSHSKATGGTGLGLSIVKHAVLFHGGSIALESEEGQGTRITVTLPKCQ